MATYHTKRCPHCRQAYVFHQWGDQTKFGCPIIRCNYCGEYFWDSDVLEPALYGFHDTSSSVLKWFVLCLYSIIPIAALFFSSALIIGAIKTGDWSDTGVIVLFALISIAPIAAFVSTIKDLVEKKRDREKNLINQRSEYDASMKRLKDIEYVRALAKRDERAKLLLKCMENGTDYKFVARP